MLTAFFFDDKGAGNLNSNSAYAGPVSGDLQNVPANLSDPRPKIAWVSGPENLTGGSTGGLFFTADKLSMWLDVSNHGGWNPETLEIQTGMYSGGGLATEITNKFAASINYTTWECSYNAGDGQFKIHNPSNPSAQMKIKWKTGDHGTDNDNDSMAAELGYTASADVDITTGTYPANERRWHTFTYAKFNLESSPGLSAALCQIKTGKEVSTTNPYIYGAGTNLGTNPSEWQGILGADGADTKVELLPPNDESPENQIRVGNIQRADPPGPNDDKYWYFLWRHQDSLKSHEMNLAMLFPKVSSTTRTVSTLSGHGITNPQRGLGINNYYPVKQLQRWLVPLGFDAWGESDYRDVVQAVVRNGKDKGVLWALRWDDIVSGSVTIPNEVEKGFMVWGALQDYSLDTFVGDGSDYMSGELVIEQIR